MEESTEIDEALSDTESTVDETGENGENTSLASTDEMIIQMLSDIQSEHIDNQLLIQQYQRLTA